MESAYNALNNAFIEFALNSDTVLVDEQVADNEIINADEIIDNEVSDNKDDDLGEVVDDGEVNTEEGIGNE